MNSLLLDVILWLFEVGCGLRVLDLDDPLPNYGSLGAVLELSIRPPFGVGGRMVNG